MGRLLSARGTSRFLEPILGPSGKQRWGRAPTLAGVVEMVVILRHVSHDAEAVGDFHGDHVVGI